MPASEQSILITDTYRRRLVMLRDRLGQMTRSRWAGVTMDDLEGSHARWVAETSAALEVAQRAGVQLTAAYLSAFIASESGQRPSVTGLDADPFAGVAQDGRPVAEALAASLTTIRVAFKAGAGRDEAFARGLNQGTRLATSAVMAAPRGALADQIVRDDRIVGWRRVTHAGCGACLAAATGAIQSDSAVLLVHDNCQCTKEPLVADAPERVYRPTGQQMFAAMARDRQDELLGPEKAQLIRDGTVPFDDLLSASPMHLGPDQITEASLAALT